VTRLLRVAYAREALAHTPLRVRLVAAVLVLAALALLATGLVGTTALRGYLLSRLDGQLAGISASVEDRLSHGVPAVDRNGSVGGTSPGTVESYLAASTADGQLQDALVPSVGPQLEKPALPLLTAAAATARNGRPFTVTAADGHGSWRVLVTLLPGGGPDGGNGEQGTVTSGGTSLAVALPLRDVDSTVDRVIVNNLKVGALVLAVLAALAYLVVRRSLRGLNAVESTAEAIAAGDLSRRAPGPDRRTEVGRVAYAFNAMLDRLSAAFSDREQATTRAVASEDKMRRFIADASHELRTPLTSIRGFAELHRQGAIGDPQAAAHVMARIEAEATRMGVLVEDLLELARLDQQRPMEKKPVDLLLVAADVVHDADALSEHHVSLRVATEPGTLPVVLGDDARLRQVVTNLVGNALTHTPAGTSVVVTVSSTTSEASVQVGDDGPGIASEDTARVFERFYRVDASRSRASGGNGLGLSIAAAIVTAHGGHISLDSTPGPGARFTVRLPLADAAGERTTQHDHV